jgi:hypothetical protein
MDYIGGWRRASADSGVTAAGVRGRREQVREKKRERGTGGSAAGGVGAGAGPADMRSSGSVDLGVVGAGGLNIMGGGGRLRSGENSPADSRAASPNSARREAAATVQAAQRILTLATESLDMMRGVTGVVKDSLERAEMWVNRLRVVGMHSPVREDAEEDGECGGGGGGGGEVVDGPTKLMGEMKLAGEMEVEVDDVHREERREERERKAKPCEETERMDVD